MKNKIITKINKKPSIFTIGHSTHPITEFIELLQIHQIQLIVDVRTIPKSRHNPQFNKEELKQSLKQVHISYKHLKKLGGLRHTTKDSINLAWRNHSFRGYADYMASIEFKEGLLELIKLADVKTAAIMCAEALPWRCHRSLIADALSKSGWQVFNIMGRSPATKHLIKPFLKVKNGQIIYPKLKI